jgi:hypothetical protein
MPPAPRLVACLALAVLAGCIDVPELDRAIEEAAADAVTPDLRPIDPADYADTPPAEAQAEINTALGERAGDLAARAEALPDTIIDEATRARMLDTVTE